MKINHFLLRLLKENIIYLSLLIFILIIYVVFFIVLINKNNELSNKIWNIKNEINALEKEVNLINYGTKIREEGIDIDKINKILYQLIPDEEDYFSIIFSLEKLSKETRFLIDNYTINFNKSKNNKLNLTIEGFGDQESFFNFLRKYRYSGGRLLTIDKIEYQGEQNVKAKLNIYFYNGRLPSLKFTNNYQFNNDQKEIIKKIQEEVSINFDSSSQKEEEYLYSTKSNPF